MEQNKTNNIESGDEIMEPYIPMDILEMMNGKVIDNKQMKKNVIDLDDIESDKLLELIEKKKETFELNNIEPYKISTQSATCILNHAIDISTFANIVREIVISKSLPNIIGVDYNMIKTGVFKKKKTIKIKDELMNDELPSKREKKMYNEVSIIYKTDDKGDRCVNIKFFKNGSISMTGCEKKDDGIIGVNYIINNIMKKHANIFYNENDITDIKMYNYSITMINSNFSLGTVKIDINRNILYNIILNNYNLYVNFTPEKYAGIKISYMYNNNNKKRDGICYCEPKCVLEKRRRKKNICKIISIMIFSTCEIIITGAKIIEQLDEAYKFMTDILKKHCKEYIIFKIDELIKELKEKNQMRI